MRFDAWIEDRLTRGLRLAVLATLVALLFPRARFWALLILALLLAVHGVRTWRRGGWRYVVPVLLVGVGGLGMLLWANHHRAQVEDYLALHRPLSLRFVPDGQYLGRGPGNNGTIAARLTVKDEAIERVEVVSHRDAVYAFDDVLPALPGRQAIDLSHRAGFVFRNERSIAGLQAALEDAVLQTVFDAPRLTWLDRAVFWATSNRGGKITVNAMAILFIVLLAFDYTFGPALRPGLGQSLNCYNCQACVGVCPVKIVAGDPFPMTMVLMARLGDVDRVVQLAKFCVGCGNCAAKCPVGNSGPSIAAAGYLVWRERHRREQRVRDAEVRRVTGEAAEGGHD